MATQTTATVTDTRRTAKIHIRGVSHMMMVNPQLADPLCEITAEIRKLTTLHASRKTPEIYKRIGDLQWLGALNLNDDKRVIVPGYLIQGAYHEAGLKCGRKFGPKVRKHLWSVQDWLLIYDGPKDLDKLMADPRFRDRRSVVHKSRGEKTRVMRTWPIFRGWSLKYELLYETRDISPDDVLGMTKKLAEIGLSEDRTNGGGQFDIIEYVD